MPPEIAQAAKAMSLDPGPWGRIFDLANAPLRAGSVSLSPRYTITRLVRNLSFAGVKGMPPWDMAVGMLHALRRDGDWAEFLRSGGGMGTADIGNAQGYTHAMANFTKSKLQREQAQLEALVKQTGGVMPQSVGAAANLFNPVRLLTRVNEVIDQGPRIAAFTEAKQKGWSNVDAARAARRMPGDFSRGGQLSKQLSPGMLFFNDRIRSALDVGRATVGTDRWNPYSQSRVANTARLAALTTAAVGAYLYNRTQPGYDDVPQYVKDGALVLMLPGTSEGNPKYLAFGLRDLAFPMTIINAYLGHLDANHPNAVTRVANDLGYSGFETGPTDSRGADEVAGAAVGQISPVQGEAAAGPANQPGFVRTAAPMLSAVVPAPVKAGVGWLSNFDYFRGRPIVSQGQQQLPPGQQFTPHTSELARQFGEAHNISPEQLDAAARAVGGTLASTALSASNTLAGQSQSSIGVPGVEGVVGGVYGTQGGQQINDAYSAIDQAKADAEARANDWLRSYEEASPQYAQAVANGSPVAKTYRDQVTAAYTKQLMAARFGGQDPATELGKYEKQLAMAQATPQQTDAALSYAARVLLLSARQADEVQAKYGSDDPNLVSYYRQLQAANYRPDQIDAAMKYALQTLAQAA